MRLNTFIWIVVAEFLTQLPLGLLSQEIRKSGTASTYNITNNPDNITIESNASQKLRLKSTYNSVVDTTALKSFDPNTGHLVYLKGYSASTDSGSGWFVYRDSTYAEGIGAFDATGNVGKQWVRLQYLEDRYNSVVDTSTLKLFDSHNGELVYLKGLSSGSILGGGWFIYMDSTYTEGVIAYDASVASKQWVRVKYLTLDVVYADWTGATGDSLTDDATALQRALTAAAGRTLVIPKGIYLINGSHLLCPSNTTIIGSGCLSTVLKTTNTSSTFNIVKLDSVHKVTLRNLYFHGSGRMFYQVAGDPSSSASVYSHKCSHVVIDHCYFYNGNFDYGDESSNYITVTNCIFYSNYPTTSPQGFGGVSRMAMNGTEHLRVLSNSFIEAATDSSKQTQYFLRIAEDSTRIASNVEVAYNSFVGLRNLGGNAVLLGVNNGRFHHNSIIGDTITTANDVVAIVLNNDGDYQCKDLVIEDNYISDMFYGVRAFDNLSGMYGNSYSNESGSYITVRNNQFYNTTRTIMFETGGDNITISGNVITSVVNPKSLGTPCGRAIICRSLSYSTISDNHISETIRDAIELETETLSLPSVGVKIANNYCYHIGDGTYSPYGLRLFGTAADSVADLLVVGNVVDSVGADGIGMQYCVDVTVSNNQVLNADIAAYGATSAGIRVKSCSRVLVSNNLSITTVSGSNQNYGITISNTSKDISVVYNNFYREKTDPISDSGTRTIKYGNRYTKEGQLQGRATLVAGVDTVATKEVVADDNILLSRVKTGGTPGHLTVGTITAGTSFVIYSSSNTDVSTIYWEIRH